MTNRIKDLLTKYISKPEVAKLIDDGSFSEVIKQTVGMPAFTYTAIKELVKLFLDEGFKLIELFDKPKIKINTTRLAEVTLNDETKSAGKKYAAEIIDPTFCIFMTMLTSAYYSHAWCYVWIKSPEDLTAPYPQILVNCDSKTYLENFLIKDCTEILDKYITTEEDYDYIWEGGVPTIVYDIEGKESDCASILEASLEEFVDEQWEKIFVANKKFVLGL